MTYLEKGNDTFKTGAAGLNEITKREAMREAWKDLDKGLKPEFFVRHNARRCSAWALWYVQGAKMFIDMSAPIASELGLA